MEDHFRIQQITGHDDPRAALKEITLQEVQADEDADEEARVQWEQQLELREQENLHNIHLHDPASQESVTYTTETSTQEEKED